MSIDPLFKKIEDALVLGEIPVRFFPETEESPLPFLVIDTGMDESDRQRILTIHITEQEFGQNVGQSSPQEAPIIFVEFSFEYPFTFDPQYGKDVGSLLHFLNRNIKLAGFQLDEAENKVLFQYNLVISPEGITDILILSLVGMIMLATDMYSYAIESLAKGEMSFNDLMIQCAEQLQEGI